MRSTWVTPGGVHPPENKHQSVTMPIGSLPIPEKLLVPLSQHIGAPAKACVKVGTKVLKGQKIAEATGAVSVPMHAPTSGTVTAIEDRPIAHSSGMSAPCIEITSDGPQVCKLAISLPNHADSKDFEKLKDTFAKEAAATIGSNLLGENGTVKFIKT